MILGDGWLDDDIIFRHTWKIEGQFIERWMVAQLGSEKPSHGVTAVPKWWYVWAGVDKHLET